MEELLALHRQVLRDAVAEVALVTDQHLTLPTPCADWDLGALLAHMTGQQRGFAQAIDEGAAPADAYRPVPFDPASFAESVDRLGTSIAGATPGSTVQQVELNPTTALPVATVISAQLLDTAVHTWDVAWSIGRSYTPDPGIARRVLAIAATIPDGPNRTAERAAFAPGLHTAAPDADAWRRCLALLGRSS